MTADQTVALSKETQFWDRIAPRYAKSPVRDQAAYEHTLDRVAHYLRPEHQVLELGCGTGTTAVHLAPKAATCNSNRFVFCNDRNRQVARQRGGCSEHFLSGLCARDRAKRPV